MASTGNCPGIEMSPIYYNDSSPPNMQGGTNDQLHDANGVCQAALIVKLAPGQCYTVIIINIINVSVSVAFIIIVINDMMSS